MSVSTHCRMPIAFQALTQGPHITSLSSVNCDPEIKIPDYLIAALSFSLQLLFWPLPKMLFLCHVTFYTIHLGLFGHGKLSVNVSLSITSFTHTKPGLLPRSADTDSCPPCCFHLLYTQYVCIHHYTLVSACSGRKLWFLVFVWMFFDQLKHRFRQSKAPHAGSASCEARSDGVLNLQRLFGRMVCVNWHPQEQSVSRVS